MVDPPLAFADLDHVFGGVFPLWNDLRKRRLFMTGASGFVGGWMLEALLSASDRLCLECEVTVLTRNPAGFAADAQASSGTPLSRSTRATSARSLTLQAASTS